VVADEQGDAVPDRDTGVDGGENVCNSPENGNDRSRDENIDGYGLRVGSPEDEGMERGVIPVEPEDQEPILEDESSQSDDDYAAQRQQLEK
jgi:hypothetical protein